MNRHAEFAVSTLEAITLAASEGRFELAGQLIECRFETADKFLERSYRVGMPKRPQRGTMHRSLKAKESPQLSLGGQFGRIGLEPLGAITQVQNVRADKIDADRL